MHICLSLNFPAAVVPIALTHTQQTTIATKYDLQASVHVATRIQQLTNNGAWDVDGGAGAGAFLAMAMHVQIRRPAAARRRMREFASLILNGVHGLIKLHETAFEGRHTENQISVLTVIT